MSSNRHIARIALIQTLFAWEFRGGDIHQILDYFLEQFYPTLTNRSFIEKTLNGILEKREEIQKIVTETAPEWSFEKIAPIDRAILELGVYELIVSDKEVPPLVAVNEAIEIAKSMGNENSAKFINGVLSAVMKKYKPKP